MKSIIRLYLFAFMAVTNQCEELAGNWLYSAPTMWGNYTHPRCIEKNHIFETREELAAFLKQQDHRITPYAEAYEIKHLSYDLKVETEDRKRTQEIIESVETKREIIFK